MSEKIVQDIIRFIGEDTEREGLRDTPRRVLRSWKEMYAGYQQNPKEILSTTFSATGHNQMIICRDIDFYSTCEHHMLPFFGKIHLGYTPKNKIVGLSKIPRLIECFARRLQIQENLTDLLADTFQEIIQPVGVGVFVEARHMCMLSRGVRNHSSIMMTTALRGEFLDNPKTRSEFLSSINHGI